MKITKDEKSLYKLLDVVNKIFGKSSNKTYLIGEDRKLYFYTLGYCGVFVSNDDNNHILNAYDFDYKQYQLKQLPNKEYVLDHVVYDDLIPDNVKSFIDRRVLKNEWQMEMYKDYPCKAAKIAVHTNKWIRDDDLSLLKAFADYDVFLGTDCLVFKHENELCRVYIVLMDSVVAPDADDVTQLKVYVDIETSMFKRNEDVSQPPEEFEDDGFDEEDPMA